MSLITPDQAKKQVRDLQIADPDIQLLIDNAESYVAGFLDRDIYEDDTARTTARTAAPTTFAAGLADITARTTAAMAETDEALRSALLAAIAQDARSNLYTYQRAMAGVVVNGRIRAGILLMIGHLYANAEAVIVDQGVQALELPLGVTNLLFNDRRLGV